MIGFKSSLKNFFTIKKNSSIEKISCYNKSECFMLKTISYSIVFVSEIENNVIINNLFDDINSTRILRKDIIEKVFPNENITIEHKGNPMLSRYITSNGFKMTFEKPFRMIIECKCNGDDKKEEYINLIAQKIIDIIKEERKNNINGLISAMGFNYDFIEETENPVDKLKKLTSINNEALGDVVMALAFKKTDNETLNLTIVKDREKNNCISYKANLDVKITDNINICDLLKEKQKEFIVNTILNLYGEKETTR